MRIIQLGDVHLSKVNLENLKQFYLKALIDDLNHFKPERPIDLLLILGDLVDKGGESFFGANAYQLFNDEFLKPLISGIKLPENKVLFIPGNHDIQRNEIDEIYEQGLIGSLKTIDKINNELLKQKVSFNSANLRLKQFKDFERIYKENVVGYNYTNNESTYIYQSSEGKKIGCLLVNDSWRCSDKLTIPTHVIGTNQFYDAKLQFEKENTEFNLVLFHHPIESFSEIERDEIKNILQKFNFEIAFFGHTHKSALNSICGVTGNIAYLSCRAAFNNPREELAKFQPGYNIVDIELDSLKLTCYFRTYVHARYAFDTDVNAAENGIFRCILIPSADKKELYDLYDLTNKTVGSHIEDFNNALVIYKTNTIAPKTVKELFVLPKLMEKPENYNSVENVKRYSIEDLLNEKNNLLVIGNRETGKTTLLNRISTVCADYFSQVQKVPIIVDYKKLIKEEVASSIRKYLNENNAKVESLSSSGRILLLIDNFEEGEEYIYAKKHLENFIIQYPKNKIIATTSSPIELFLQNESSLISRNIFTPIFIGSIGVREFKELATKWFQEKDHLWHQENIEKLIRVFKILRIPRTFFSVSLYLWILEKEKDFQPVNKSYLINKFLQFILEGLIEEEAKAGAINFERKKEILAEIALKMYGNGSSLKDYSLTKEEIVNVISSYFKNNLRNRDPNDLYCLFAEKGLFKLDADNLKITFRFESFFQYFLSLNIESNVEFKGIVLSKENVISFIDELDYYTGRHQDNKEVLSIAVELLKESFKEIDVFIDDNTDKYFPSRPVLINNVDYAEIHSNLKKGKLSNEEIDKLLDQEMTKLPVTESIRIKKRYNNDYSAQFNLVLELAARLLKNAENIQEPELINTTLDLIIQKAAKLGVLTRTIILKVLKDEGSNWPPFLSDFFGALIPIINQELLLNWMGTDFLQLPLENRIKKYCDNPKNQSEHEIFLINFLYDDLKLKNYVQYTEKIVKQINNRYFAELFFLKIYLSYSKKSNGSSLLAPLENQMVTALMKAKDIPKAAAKTTVESDIREKKKEANDDSLDL